ncbi:MAG: GyrI-like domain-containing protein [Saprospiraceae bacterium]
MNKVTIPSFQLIGMTIRTTNANQQSAKDIPALWEKFMMNQSVDKIPNKLSNDIYCVYTKYEGDHTLPYTTFLGCKVDQVAELPAEMESLVIEAGTYFPYTAEGNLMEGAVWKKWVEIWETDLDRTFRSDFEVYSEKAQNPANAVVDIFVGVR